jgi:hypothetical protein
MRPKESSAVPFAVKDMSFLVSLIDIIGKSGLVGFIEGVAVALPAEDRYLVDTKSWQSLMMSIRLFLKYSSIDCDWFWMTSSIAALTVHGNSRR